MTEKIIIGVAGKKQSGKGTVCSFLEDNTLSLFPTGRGEAVVRRFPMAGPIKRMCVEVFGLRPEQVYGTDEQKNSPTGYRWEDLPHYERLRRLWDAFDVVYAGTMTARQVMQQVGTMFRLMDNDIWVKACLRDIEASDADVALIDDVRFPNEVEHVQRGGGFVCRLTRVVFPDDRHESETSLDADVYDWKNFDHVAPDADARTVCRSVVEALYGDGRLKVAIKKCFCCPGIDPDDLDYSACGEA